MNWYEDIKLLERLENSAVRRTWAEEKAYAQYFQIEYKLPKELKGPTRVGALTIAEMRGIEGKHYWMLPVEGHKKLLAPKNEVKLFDQAGTVFYEGKWAEVDPKLIESREEFFIWMKPREDAAKGDLPLGLRIKGFIRYLLHKKRS